jgi:MFS superfamily sulfate permease-like transporter
MKQLTELRASLVVFLVALPLCLGIALASQAPLAAGIMAGIIGGIVVGMFSGSEVSVSGPAAGLTVIVATTITQLGSFELFCLSVLLAGLFQIAFGLVRAGDLGMFFPSSVIKGMLSAIGLILIMKQSPTLVGWSNGSITSGVALVGVISLLLLLAWDSFFVPRFAFARLIPGALVAVFAAVMLNALVLKGTSFEVGAKALVALPFDGSWGGFWQSLQLPDWQGLAMGGVWKTALTLAIVASLETILSLDAADKMDPLKRISNKNRELFAQGLGNATSGLVGALPVTAVIVRTTANVSAGARFRTSAIVHGFWLLICAMFIPRYLNLIPLTTLAAVLLLVGFKLCKPALFKDQWKAGKEHFIQYVVTIVAILLTDLLVGIGVGLGLSILLNIKRYRRTAWQITQTERFAVLEFQGHATFLHKLSLSKALSALPENMNVDVVSKGQWNFHPDIEVILSDFHKQRAEKNIQVTLRHRNRTMGR